MHLLAINTRESSKTAINNRRSVINTALNNKTALKCLRPKARSVLSDLEKPSRLLEEVLYKWRLKRLKNKGINRRKDTLIKKAYELGEFNGINVALIICKHGRYTTYSSKGYASRLPSMAEIVSKAIARLKYTTVLIVI